MECGGPVLSSSVLQPGPGRSPEGRERGQGFTLIELLVVIAIISLLMAILIPTLNMARKQVRGTVCMAALKQWGLCYQL